MSSNQTPAQAYDLTGKVAVVTGAASGIGRATAMTLANAGASVACADIAPKLEETAAAIRQTGGKALAVLTDVSRKADVEALVQKAVAEFGRLDVMCNVAGIMANCMITDIEDEHLDRVLGINLKGALYGCQAASKQMLQQGEGSIINVVSDILDAAAPTTAMYGMAKAALAQLTRTLAREVGPSGVRVNALAPGFVETGITARHYTRTDGTIDEAKRQEVLKMLTTRRLVPWDILPDDMGAVALFLASPASRSVTGQILRANGGAFL
jgi:3-oxoacyl-[acyl-carrier protein] reductase